MGGSINLHNTKSGAFGARTQTETWELNSLEGSGELTLMKSGKSNDRRSHPKTPRTPTADDNPQSTATQQPGPQQQQGGTIARQARCGEENGSAPALKIRPP
eukprot:gene20572-61954_t